MERAARWSLACLSLAAGACGPDCAIYQLSLDPPSLEIPTAASIGFDGRSFVLGWVEGFGDPPLRVARVAPTGQILDRDGITVRAGDSRASDRGNRVPVIASSGDESLVVWGRRSFRRGVPAQLMAARLLPDGSLRDREGIIVAQGQDLPAVAWDGQAYFVVGHEGLSWDAERGPEPPGPVVLRGTRVFPDGRVLPQTFAIEAEWSTRSVALAANGDVLVVWNDTFDSSPDRAPADYSRIMARFVGMDGRVGDSVRVLP